MQNQAHWGTFKKSDSYSQTVRHPSLPQSRFSHDYAEADILKLAAFIRSNPVPILVSSPEGQIIKANPSAVRLLRRLAIAESDLLPPDHRRIVQACLAGSLREYGTKIRVGDRLFALTYHPLLAFKMVYLYIVEAMDSRQVDCNQTLNTLDDFFIAMDGCVFSGKFTVPVGQVQ